MRFSSLHIFGVTALASLTAVWMLSPKDEGFSAGRSRVPAATAEAVAGPERGAIGSVTATERSVDIARPRATSSRELMAKSAATIVVLDPAEPEMRIDIGELLDVDLALLDDAKPERNIGQILDAEDPLLVATQEPAGPSVDVGELLDADAPDSLANLEPEAALAVIGELRDADPLAYARWWDEQTATADVRDIGPKLPVPDETTSPWPLNFETSGF